MNNIEIAPPPCNNSLIELLALADCWIPKPGSACAIDIGGPIPHGKAWEHYFEFIRLNGYEPRLSSLFQKLLARAGAEVNCYLALFGVFRSSLLNAIGDFIISSIRQASESLNPQGTTTPVFLIDTRKTVRKSSWEQFDCSCSSTPSGNLHNPLQGFRGFGIKAF